MYTIQNQQKKSHSPFSYANPHQKTVLYIEDDLANIQLVEQIIERRNDLRILTANSCHGGIMMAQDFQPDVIVMDINLPDLNGFEALEILRNDPITAHIPIMALSAAAHPEQIDKGIKAGFFMYMTKPFHIDDFMKAIDATIFSSIKIH